MESSVQKRKANTEEEKQSSSGSPGYLALLAGPLFFTAPHSGKVKRGGPEYGDNRRVHLREKYTACLAMRMAFELSNQKAPLNSLGTGSFCVWKKDHKLNDADEDPNYLLFGRESRSPFHRMLHAWILANPGKPLLHIDVHGKMDRKDSYELDLGVSCMFKHWDQDLEFQRTFVAKLKEGFDRVLAPLPKWKEYKAICQAEPYLNGNWGGDLRTMTEQAIELGVPSFQLEIPLKMRAQLFKDEALLKSFLGVILEVYSTILVPYWAKKQIPLRCNEGLAFQDLKYMNAETPEATKMELVKKLEQYTEWEKKQSLTTDKII